MNDYIPAISRHARPIPLDIDYDRHIAVAHALRAAAMARLFRRSGAAIARLMQRGAQRVWRDVRSGAGFPPAAEFPGGRRPGLSGGLRECGSM